MYTLQHRDAVTITHSETETSIHTTMCPLYILVFVYTEDTSKNKRDKCCCIKTHERH